MALSPTVDFGIATDLRRWLPRQRWFGAFGRDVAEVATVRRIVMPLPPATDGPAAVWHLVRVRFTDGGPHHLYQVLLGVRRRVPDAVPHDAVITGAQEGVVYDGFTDPELTLRLLALIQADATLEDLRFAPESGVDFPAVLGPHLTAALAQVPPESEQASLARRFVGEQSNTSVVFDHRAILKVFRIVAPGVHPDLELHRALNRAGSPHVARVLGSIEGAVDGAAATMGILQSFAANAADGWAMATASLREFLDEARGSRSPEEAGGTFAFESHRMGEAVAAVHADLARELGTATVPAAELAAALRADLAAAVAVAPVLAAYRPAVTAAYADLYTLDKHVHVQRIHGDLHLGQALRTPTTWWLLDFEGEPARPLAARSELRSPWHDVACMLRSFDYAAAQPATEISRHEERRRRADRWVRLNRSAFVAGYALRSGRDPRASALLLHSLELARVVYEVTYEARNRPDWIGVPLAALRRLLGGGA